MPATTTAVETTTTAVETAPSMKSSAPEAAAGEMVSSIMPIVPTAPDHEFSTVIRAVVAVVGTVISIVRAGIGVVAAVRGVADTPRLHGAPA